MRRCFGVLGALLVLTLGGCGGSSDSSTATITVSSLSKPQFTKKAEAICTKESEPLLGRLSNYEEAHVKPTKAGNQKVFEQAIKVVIPPAVLRMADQIRVLGAPDGEAAQIEALVVALERDAQEIRHGPPLAQPEDLDAKFRRSGKAATNAGLTACAFG